MKIENRQQILVVLTIAVVALLIANSIIFTPLGNMWSKRSKEITELRKKITNGTDMIKREKDWNARWADMRTNALPANPSLAEQQMVGEIVSWSGNTGVELPSVAPQVKNDSTNYMTINCRVEANGTMASLSQFLYNIEHRPAYKLDSVEISAHDATGEQLTLGLQINGLALLETQTKTSTKK